MKILNSLLMICLFTFGTACSGQTTSQKTDKKSLSQKENKKKDSSKPMNLIDEQVKILGGMFATLDTGNEVNPFTGSDNYLEVIEKMDAPAETKKYLREQYKLYELSLDPSKKDSLAIMVDKMLQKAIEQGKDKPNN